MNVSSIIPITIVVVTGPVGVGKSTTATKASMALRAPHFNWNHYRGIEFFSLGKERNEFTDGILRQLIAEGHKTIVVSCGGFGVNDIAKKIFGYCGAPARIIHAKTDYSNPAEIAKITDDTVRKRIAAGITTPAGNVSANEFVKSMINKSLENMKLASEIIADVTFSWNRDNVPELVENLVAIVSSHPPSPMTTVATQIRVLVTYLVDGKKCAGHITLDHSFERKIVSESVIFENGNYKGTASGHLVTAISGSNVYKVIVLNGCEVVTFQSEMQNRKNLHVTHFFPQRNRVFKPAFSAKIAEAFANHVKTVDYIADGNVIASFVISDEVPEIDVNCHGLFAF